MKFQFTAAERDIFRAKENLTVSQWAERHREVVKGPAQGRWSNDVTPYLVGPMDAFNQPSIREIFMCFAPQTGKTQAAVNCKLYAIDQDPGPMMYLMAEEKTARRISRRQIIPTIRATRRLARKISSRKTDVATLAVTFTNGADLMLGWATSPSVMASESIRYFFGDEPGKYPAFSGKEADPFTLSRMRTNAYPYTSKIMWFSTPNEDGDGFSREINSRPDVKYRFSVPCHLCGKWQFMEFDGIVFPKKERDPRIIVRKKLARYQCAGCGMDWTDADKSANVRRGKWQPVGRWPWENDDDGPSEANVPERPRVVAYHLPAWYSPWVSLSACAAAFLEGINDHSKMMAFVTQYKAEPWKASLETKKESQILRLRSVHPPMIVPDEALALTMGIDVQKVGFWFVVRAWARDFTSWLINYGYVGDFDGLESLLNSRYSRAGGASVQGLPIWRAAIDTGGGAGEDEWSRTEEIYQWIRNQPPGRVYGIKGASRPQVKRVAPRFIDKMSNGKPIPGGLQLFLLDTSQFKDVLHWRMGRTGDDSQRFFLHSDTGADYAAQILAEEKRKSRSGKIEWKQVRKNNHLLDCEVYAAACVDNEWNPSFSILAAQMEARTKTASPKTSKPPAKSNAGPAVPGQRSPEENRGLW